MSVRKEAVQRFLWPTNDWILFVKDVFSTIWNTSEIPESIKPIVERIGASVDRLQSARAINVGDGRDQRTLAFSELENLHHKWNIVVLFEPVADRFLENRGCKRAKGLAALDLGVEDRLHVGATATSPIHSCTAASTSLNRPVSDPVDENRSRPPLVPVDWVGFDRESSLTDAPIGRGIYRRRR